MKERGGGMKEGGDGRERMKEKGGWKREDERVGGGGWKRQDEGGWGGRERMKGGGGWKREGESGGVEEGG